MHPPPLLPLDKYMIWERKAILREHLSDNISCTAHIYAVPRLESRGDLMKTQLPNFSRPPNTISKSRCEKHRAAPTIMRAVGFTGT